LNSGGCNTIISEKTREKISQAQLKDSVREMGIRPYYWNNEHTGYMASRIMNKIAYHKTFTNTKNSLIHNYIMAKIWYEQIKNEDTVDFIDFNKNLDLPTHICVKYHAKDSIIIGFRFKIRIIDLEYQKIYIKQSLSLKQKLELVLKEKEDYFNNCDFEIKDDKYTFEIGDSKYTIEIKDRKHIVSVQGQDALKVNILKEKRKVIREYNLPSNININKPRTKTGICAGFYFSMQHQCKTYKKTFGNMKAPLSKTLIKALDYRSDMYKKFNIPIIDGIYNFIANDIEYTINIVNAEHKISISKPEASIQLDLPKFIAITKYNNKITGFRFQVRKTQDMDFSKQFASSEKTLPENLELALTTKRDHLLKHNKPIEDTTHTFIIDNIEYTITIKDTNHTVSTLITQ